MEFRILGLLEVVRGSRRLDQLWGEEPPPRATVTLQAYVSNLRRILEPERRPRSPANVLVTQPPGYVLRVDSSRVDFLAFEALATKGRQLLAEGNPRTARDAFTESLALWRGPALAGILV